VRASNSVLLFVLFLDELIINLYNMSMPPWWFWNTLLDLARFVRCLYAYMELVKLVVWLFLKKKMFLFKGLELDKLEATTWDLKKALMVCRGDFM
jgi:hypothetical protein